MQWDVCNKTVNRRTRTVGAPYSDVFTMCTVVNAPRTVRTVTDMSLRSSTTNIIQPYTIGTVAVSTVCQSV